VETVEREFAAFCGTAHAIGVASGTDALEFALEACGVRPHDEVITVPTTFIATAEAISAVGASIRFVDVDPATGNMDPGSLEAAITPRTRAIIPVHLYGQPAEMDPILEIARSQSLRVICDAAQAHGASYRNRPIATYGDAACFSFYPGKNLGAYGDAGALATDDAEVARRVAMRRNHGRTKKYEHEIEGRNSRLDGLQAAVLSVKLRHLDEWTGLRRAHAARYDEALGPLVGLDCPPVVEHARSVYHLYVVRTAHRDLVDSHLREHGVGAGMHYPVPLHLQPAYARLGHGRGDFPAAERLCAQCLSIPMYPELTTTQIDLVCEYVREAVRRAQ
jgi:dTDP-4-amino-4,6-dideoxygalactose transaminase